MNLNIKKLEVIFNQDKVGILKEVNGIIYFQYERDWLKKGFPISPYSLPLVEDVFTSKSQYFEGVFGVFYDSLPDGWGRLLLNRYLAQIGINYETLPILDKLSLTNIYSKGALSYIPCNDTTNRNIDYDLDKIASMFRNIFDNDSNLDLDKAYLLGGSSGGARPKAFIKFNNEEWIVKFPSKIDPKEIGYQEYLANNLADKCGINVNEYKLFPSKVCKGYFGSKRFDRKNNRRIHMISLSSLLETSYQIPNLDYLILFKVIKQISNRTEDLYDAFKRMCFNILYKNKDDHGNNFAFIYDDLYKSYVLSPFYDITSTKDKLEHEMTLLGKGNPNSEDIIESISKIGLDRNKCLDILNNVKSILSTVNNVGNF